MKLFGTRLLLPESVDLDGNPRIKFGQVDCGSYESLTTPALFFVW